MIVYKVCSLDLLDKRVSYTATGRYKKEYIKGVKVEYEKGTFGIFVFENIEDARSFSSDMYRPYTAIIKVRAFGQLPTPSWVCQCTAGEDLDIYYELKRGSITNPPPGTLCFKSVIPLE